MLTAAELAAVDAVDGDAAVVLRSALLWNAHLDVVPVVSAFRACAASR